MSDFRTVVAVGTTKRGKWTYYLPVIYTLKPRKRDGVYTYRFVERIHKEAHRSYDLAFWKAELYARENQIQFSPHVRHGHEANLNDLQKITIEAQKGEAQ